MGKLERANKGHLLRTKSKVASVYKMQLFVALSLILALTVTCMGQRSSTTTAGSSCACSDHTVISHKGKIGRCFTQYQGDYWCYVKNGAGSGCSDLKKSERDNQLLYWSVLACDTYDAVPISG